MEINLEMLLVLCNAQYENRELIYASKIMKI